MAQPPSVGVLAHLGMNTDTSSTPAAAAESYEFLSENLTTEQEIIRTDGLRGTRVHLTERIRRGRTTPGGSIVMQPTYAELVALLPRCIGAASSGAHTPSDTVPVAFQTIIDRVAKVVTYTGCRCDRVTFRSGPGQPLEMTVDIEALTESVGAAGSFASLTVSATPPFVFTDGVLTLGGTAYQVLEFSTTVDWHLKKDRWVNSTTRTDLPSLDLTIGTRFVVPYTSDQVGLYDNGGAVSGIAGNINFTYLGAGGGAAGVNLKFDFANLVFPAKKSPNVQGRDEITLLLEGEARKTGSTAPLIVSLDSTV